MSNKIIDASISDLVLISDCYMRSFPNSLTTLLGKNYVINQLKWYLIDEENFLFFLKKNGKCIGFCGGMNNYGKRNYGSTSSMIQHSINHALKALLIRPWLLFNPKLYKNFTIVIKNIFIKLFSYGNKKVVKKDKNQVQASLIVIGVHPKYQGNGLAKLLIDQFEMRAVRNGFAKAQLSVLKKNIKAIRAYEKNKWIVEKEVENSLNMVKYLDKNPQS